MAEVVPILINEASQQNLESKPKSLMLHENLKTYQNREHCILYLIKHVNY
jgi:hypothetical protein